jgi:hypothetical protein
MYMCFTVQTDRQIGALVDLRAYLPIVNLRDRPVRHHFEDAGVADLLDNGSLRTCVCMCVRIYACINK